MQNAPIGTFTALMGTIFVTISVFMSRANFWSTFGPIRSKPIGSIGQADQGWEKSIGLIGWIGQGWLIDCRVTSMRWNGKRVEISKPCRKLAT